MTEDMCGRCVIVPMFGCMMMSNPEAKKVVVSVVTGRDPQRKGARSRPLLAYNGSLAAYLV